MMLTYNMSQAVLTPEERLFKQRHVSNSLMVQNECLKSLLASMHNDGEINEHLMQIIAETNEEITKNKQFIGKEQVKLLTENNHMTLEMLECMNGILESRK